MILFRKKRDEKEKEEKESNGRRNEKRKKNKESMGKPFRHDLPTDPQRKHEQFST